MDFVVDLKRLCGDSGSPNLFATLITQAGNECKTYVQLDSNTFTTTTIALWLGKFLCYYCFKNKKLLQVYFKHLMIYVKTRIEMNS